MTVEIQDGPEVYTYDMWFEPSSGDMVINIDDTGNDVNNKYDSLSTITK